MAGGGNRAGAAGERGTAWGRVGRPRGVAPGARMIAGASLARAHKCWWEPPTSTLLYRLKKTPATRLIRAGPKSTAQKRQSRAQSQYARKLQSPRCAAPRATPGPAEVPAFGGSSCGRIPRFLYLILHLPPPSTSPRIRLQYGAVQQATPNETAFERFSEGPLEARCPRNLKKTRVRTPPP